MRLSDFEANTYSQFGEDGVIDHIFNTIGTVTGVAVEFGAGDGLSCANTAHLWRDQGWKALLIEADAGRFDQLEANTADYADVVCRRVYLTPGGPDSITSHIADLNIATPDLMSIDIDGDDYFIFAELTCRPRVISIEFNPTIPPHLEVRQAETGSGFGASLLAIINLAKKKEYTFIGATYCNAFFVTNDQAKYFVDYEVDPLVLFPSANYTYAVTDYGGNVVLVGQALPWQSKAPFVDPLVASGYVMPITNDTGYLRTAFERTYGPAIWLEAAGLNPKDLRVILGVQGPPLVLLDLTRATLTPPEWMATGLEATHYRTILTGQLLAFIRKP